MAYLDATTFKKTLEMTGETFADDDISLSLDTASTAVDHYCGRHFTKDTSDKTRTYRTSRRNKVEIDDLVSVTTVEGDAAGNTSWAAWAADTDYFLEPVNGAADGVPFTSIRLAPYTTRVIDPGLTVIRVTGKFGWPAVPPSVKQATSILASRLLKRVREAPFGVAGMGADGMAVRVAATDPDVRMLLSPFVRTARLS